MYGNKGFNFSHLPGMTVTNFKQNGALMRGSMQNFGAHKQMETLS
jgi:hypothetical protein